MALWGLCAGGCPRPLRTPPPARLALATRPHQPVAAPVQFSSPRQLRAPPPFIQWLPMDTSSGSPPGPPHHVCTEAQSFSTPRAISYPSFSSLYLPPPDISTLYLLIYCLSPPLDRELRKDRDFASVVYHSVPRAESSPGI